MIGSGNSNSGGTAIGSGSESSAGNTTNTIHASDTNNGSSSNEQNTDKSVSDAQDSDQASLNNKDSDTRPTNNSPQNGQNSMSANDASGQDKPSQDKNESNVIGPDGYWTEDDLKAVFKHSHDVSFQSYQLNENPQSRVIFALAEGLSDSSMLARFVLPGLLAMYEKGILQDTQAKWTGELPMVPVDRSAKPEELAETVFRGSMLVLLPAINTLFALDAADPPRRVPNDSNTEISIKGPRDCFVEEIMTNMALIRKRIKSDSLCYESYVVGTRTKTRVGLIYFQDILSPKVLAEARKRLQQIDIDGLYSLGQLEEIISDYKYSVLPMFDFSGRPDYAVSSLLAGRFVIIVDGNPMVLIGPGTLSLLMKSPEDIHFNFFYVSFARMIRLISLLATLLLPGIWVALMAFHQDQLPFRMMATISVSRLGLPLSPQMEFFILLLLLEIFREAGVRLPNPIGQTLTVVGGLIIGDASIRAGLVSPSVVVVGAITAVAGVTLVNQTLSTTISVIRLFIFLLGCFLGMYGVILGIVLFAAYMSRLQSFGVPYTSPFSPMRLKELLPAFIRIPWKHMTNRPSQVHPIDPDHQPEQAP